MPLCWPGSRGVAERWQKRVFSAASTIQVATYSFGRPIGTSSPQTATHRLASLDNQGIDITGSVTRNPIVQAPPRYQASDFPKVDRTLKGDRLVSVTPEPVAPVPNEAAAPGNEDPSTSNASVMGAKTADAIPVKEPTKLDPELAEALSAPPLAHYDVSMSLETQPLEDLKSAPDAHCGRAGAAARQLLVQDLQPVFRQLVARFAESIERWQPGEEPLIVLPVVPDRT